MAEPNITDYATRTVTTVAATAYNPADGQPKMIPVASDGGMIVSGYNGFSPIANVSATITRPSDTTAYSANDSVSNSTSAPTALSFSGIFPNSGNDGYLIAARATVQGSAFSGTLRLHLYSSTVSAINDNAAFTLLYSNRATKIGYIDFVGFQYGGSGSDCSEAYGVFSTGSYLPVALSTGTTIYGLIEARSAFTPTSAQQFFFELKAQLS